MYRFVCILCETEHKKKQKVCEACKKRGTVVTIERCEELFAEAQIRKIMKMRFEYCTNLAEVHEYVVAYMKMDGIYDKWKYLLLQ